MGLMFDGVWPGLDWSLVTLILLILLVVQTFTVFLTLFVYRAGVWSIIQRMLLRRKLMWVFEQNSANDWISYEIPRDALQDGVLTIDKKAYDVMHEFETEYIDGQPAIFLAYDQHIPSTLQIQGKRVGKGIEDKKHAYIASLKKEGIFEIVGENDEYTSITPARFKKIVESKGLEEFINALREQPSPWAAMLDWKVIVLAIVVAAAVIYYFYNGGSL